MSRRRVTSRRARRTPPPFATRPTSRGPRPTTTS